MQPSSRMASSTETAPPNLRLVLTAFAIAAALAIASAVGLAIYYAVTWEDPTGEVSREVPPDPQRVVPEID